jgi:MFS family permease
VGPAARRDDLTRGSVGASLVSDRRLLFASALLRSTGTSLVGVLLGLYLARRALSASELGLVLSAGLFGAAAAAAVVTLIGDRLGRRATLVGLALLGAAGTLTVTLCSHPLALAAAAFAGMLNGMGRDRGAALVLEQAILPSTGTDSQRTLGFAWYTALQDAGHAAGALLAGFPLLLRQWAGLNELDSLRAVLAANAGLLLCTAGIYARLSPATEAPQQVQRQPLSPQSRSALWKLSALFGLDSLAGGFLTSAMLSYFFATRFGASESAIGLLFFGARLANAASHLGAAWLARRIGLVNTMVFTHIPSSVLLATVAFAPSFGVAAVLFLLREGLVEMDVPTRQSYVMAVVRPEERTFAAGITNLVRLGGWALAPGFAGLLMQGTSLVAPLVAGAGMKVAYDVMLYAAFRKTRPPEET